ncbi:S1 family peptidase [Actinomycetospora rhizophila]|uniref:S1 family peptidase n=1 Tax=Actinomycetospora rhizophila TaxID=1416876 RepID=A0ABV9ZMY0_9PSEU
MHRGVGLIVAAAIAAATMLSVTTPAAAIEGGVPVATTEQNYRTFGALGRVVTTYADGRWGLCTATLIAPTVAMTAQHCMPFKNDRWDEGKSPSEIDIEVAFNVLDLDDGRGVLRKVVAGTESNRDYGTENDSIFLLHLDRPVTEVTPIRAAGHQEGDLWRKGRPVFALGWGYTEEGRESRELRRADTTVRDTVATTAWKIGGALRVNDSGEGVTAPGDSGGPLITLDGADRPVVVGVLWGGGVPWGRSTERSYYMKPGVDSLFGDRGELVPNPRQVR